MSQQFIPAQPGPVEEPAPKRRRWPWVVGIVLAASVGFGAGTSGETAEPAAVTPPVPAETVTAEPEVVTETVEVAPQACLDALDAGEVGFSLASDFASAAADGFYAAAEFDLVGLEDANARIDQINEDLNPVAAVWAASKEECRAAAQ